jgi:hypothetical protein
MAAVHRKVLGMNFLRRFFRLAVRYGLLGLVSGVLSCGMADSSMLYVVREQKTYDHIVWPGLVFALIVILPISRLARDGWPRTAAALIASCAVYPIAWYIAALTTGHPSAYMVAAFAFSGFLGSLVLASVLLFGRSGWVRATGATVVVGTAIGGLMGAHLLAVTKGVVSLGSVGDVLAIYMVLWQAAVGTLLGRGVPAEPNKTAAPNDGHAMHLGNGNVPEGPPSLS